MQNDPRAPIEASLAEKAKLKKRNDITIRKTALKLAKLGGQKPEIALAKASLDQRRRILHKLLLMHEREEYFAGANSLRAQGLTCAGSNANT